LWRTDSEKIKAALETLPFPHQYGSENGSGQEGKNALICLGIMLRNNNTSME
jgi:hypothetical protein